ncbi:MAG: hypothetical protein V4679_15420 [Pseudomonadota bacterium]
MPHVRFASGLAFLLLSLLLSACTSIPQSAMPQERFAQLGCHELDNELAMAQESNRVAGEAKSTSWQLVLPVAVAARYFNANSVQIDSELRMASLREQRRIKGCQQVAG